MQVCTCYFVIGLVLSMYGKVSDGLMPVLLMAEQQLPDGEERGDSMYWREVDVVKRLLRHAVPRHLTRRNEVAIAGSAALHWYQGQTNVGTLWTDIGDIDIFVAGPNGSTEANFKDFVLSIVQRFEALTTLLSPSSATNASFMVQQ